MRVSVLLVGVVGAGLLLSSAPPVRQAQYLTLRRNGAALSTDSLSSRFEVSPGAGHVLTLTIVPADAPDDPGLTIMVDEFKPVPQVYRFKEILSGHIREASYRVGSVSAESKACALNDGEVRVTAVDAEHHLLTGTYRAVLCQTNVARSAARRLVLEGSFSFPYEDR
ncbi:hypothetical protein [Hymenobacter guriensis]|uniref:Uncharacterized protein n=1 Tax=Hymenobacter guriensis TaxID=2793065 RepID=A0ABS0L200_9BACT|nr:hypothetical protein [Hymenobacter guriensis]MBG8554138.1 hypothetical protein [Hymenobacter guriensis]